MSHQSCIPHQFTALQYTAIHSSNQILDISSYLAYGQCQVFPNHRIALSALNEKARILLDKFADNEPPSSETFKYSFQNLNASHLTCSHLLSRMRAKDIDNLNGIFQSVEFYVTGLNSERFGQVSAEHLRQTDTIATNVDCFSKLVERTDQYKKVFGKIHDLSRWPYYSDIVVERHINGEYTVNRTAKSKAVEIIASAVVVLGCLALLVLKISKYYFADQFVSPARS
ncbi:hypothetical protein [Simkania negevensis]|uniref:Uncharacterized protein n=1 Tax=Simkania negevensis (strain ATCC VR-1471 / DSM 27360 / Z) TaxID=331113 RepID=F8L4S7_SIMNZ|nr:hypothetical protein [Simkania negevensis]CCB88623.1 hypothetical protein SNE_A07460 [Simkania negevensis Z]